MSTGSPVTRHEDLRKQQLAAQLFSGVTEKPRFSAGRGQTSRITKNPGKTKTISADHGLSSADDRTLSSPRTSLKTVDKSNVDLLLGIENTEVCDIEKEKAFSKEDELLPSLNETVNISSSSDGTSGYTQESVDSDTHLAMITSGTGDGYQTTEKVRHLL